MIDAVSVVQRRASAGAGAKPRKSFVGNPRPVIGRHPPVLTGGAERVGRNADRAMEMEILLMGPDVGAVAVDHKGKVAVDRDPMRMRAASGLFPLGAGQPLQVLMKEDL